MPVYGLRRGRHLWCGRLACTRDGGSRLHRATRRATDDVATEGRHVSTGTQRGIAGIASRILQIRATSPAPPLLLLGTGKAAFQDLVHHPEIVCAGGARPARIASGAKTADATCTSQ